ncbi:NYN domain-containing protein [Candidatus Falkowbacteria bacterium]|nr:NYN domain-containing protein [Candidatus Falkowbacteria bacterium]
MKLATDLIVGAVDDKYDTAIVVSSDGDLVPAVDWVRKRKKKRAEYIGFSIADPKSIQNDGKPSQTMITNSDVQRIFIASDLKPFVKPFIQKE